MSLTLTMDTGPLRLRRDPQSDSTPTTSSASSLNTSSSLSPSSTTSYSSSQGSAKSSPPIFTIAFSIVIGFAVILALVAFVFLMTRRGRRCTAVNADSLLAPELQGAGGDDSARRTYLARVHVSGPAALLNGRRDALQGSCTFQTPPVHLPTTPHSVYASSHPDAAISRYWAPSGLGHPAAQISKVSLAGPSQISLDGHPQARSAPQHEAIYTHPIARPYSPSVESVRPGWAEGHGGAQGGRVQDRTAVGVQGLGSQRSSASTVEGFTHLMEVLGPPGIWPGQGGEELPPPYEAKTPGDGELNDEHSA